MNALTKHLNKIRKIAHEKMRDNGHYKRMSIAGKKGREEYWARKRKEKSKSSS